MTNAATNTPAPIATAARAAERDITAALVRRDPAALATLYDQHAHVVYGLVLHIVGDASDAEAIVEHVFSQAWTEAVQLDALVSHSADTSTASTLSWLTGIARTRALHVVRSHRASVRAGSAPTVQQDIALHADHVEALPLALVATAEEREVNLSVALRALPAPQRRAIELAYYAGFTHEQIAVALNEPLATIRTRIRVGMLKVKEMLSMLGQEIAR